MAADQDAEDRALVASCLAGDKAAFDRLVERYHRPLLIVSRRMLGDAEAAHDAVQNAFVKAYEKLGTFDHQRRFFSWIYRILVNECLNDRRDNPRHELLTGEELAADTPDQDFESVERRRAVQMAIRALPEEQRAVIVLRHFTELSYEEIGETLHLPAQTVKTRLHSARSRLAAILRRLDPR